MTYRIELTPTARRDVHRLPTRVAFAVVEYLEGPLAENPHRVGKMLRDDPTERYTARVGVHRILYRIDDKILVISVVRIGHRQTFIVADLRRPGAGLDPRSGP